MCKSEQEKRRNPPSLRTRYIVNTVILGLLIISIAIFFYMDVVSTKRDATNELVGLSEKVAKLDAIQNNLVGIYRSIDLFLLDPSQGNHPERIRHLIQNSVEKSGELTLKFNKKHSKLQSINETLQADFKKLQDRVNVLFESRMDITRQYPGMSISADEMTMPQRTIRGNLQLLIEEIESGELKPRSVELYPLLLKAQFMWLQHIAQLRIYLANRFASFSTELLVEQAVSLRGINKSFEESLSRLEKLYSAEESFEGPDIIQAIKRDASLWMRLFQQVSEISESDEWRADSHLMKVEVIPLIDKVILSISQLDESLSRHEKNVVVKLEKNASTLTTLLFITIALFLFFISAILWSLNWMVFKPISDVAAALKSKAFDIEFPQLLAAGSKEINALINAFREMDSQVEQRQKALEHQALHDHLTGLPNRFMLKQRLDYQLLTSEREQRVFTLMLMDLDNFKDVNDSLGHATGDRLLVELAKRLSGRMRKADTVARLGGDEFAFLIPETHKKEAEKFAVELHDILTAPVHVDGHIINVGSSFGVVSFPEDGADVETLMRHADMAMYVAKRSHTVFSEFNDSEDLYSSNRLTLINDLRAALEQDTLELYFQPQIDVNGGAVRGAEALLRWQHPEHGFVSPEKVVELAEYAGFIHQLSSWVLEHAIKQCAEWHRQDGKLGISVNLSVHDLLNTELCNNIRDLLDKYKLTSSFLTLEITESGMMENPARSVEVLKVLNEMGVILSIDDFGTGFSSLAYLKQLPVHELKIDKSFVMNMDEDESDAVIVQSTINLGHNLGLKVIAEGVENKGVFEMTDKFGCDKAQGYMFSKPITNNEFLLWLSEREC